MESILKCATLHENFHWSLKDIAKWHVKENVALF